MNIKEIRESLSLSQKEFAEYIGVSQTTVSQWEREKNIPSTYCLSIMQEKLNISLDELLGVSENIPLYTKLSANEETFLRNYRKLPLYQREGLKEIMKIILKMNRQVPNDKRR